MISVEPARDICDGPLIVTGREQLDPKKSERTRTLLEEFSPRGGGVGANKVPTPTRLGPASQPTPPFVHLDGAATRSQKELQALWHPSKKKKKQDSGQRRRPIIGDVRKLRGPSGLPHSRWNGVFWKTSDSVGRYAVLTTGPEDAGVDNFRQTT